jgi:hypothetical protein
MRATVAWVVGFTFAITGMSASPVLAQTKRQVIKGGEEWVCSLDLHQGDTGTLQFSRNAKGGIAGKTVVLRGENSFEHEIKGRWVGSEIQFKRQLSGQSFQPFEGETEIRDGSESVAMKGRFAAKLAGTWTAECRRSEPMIQRTPVAELRKPVRVRLDRVPPKVTVRVDGILSVTLGERIHITAQAQDNDGLQSITILIDGEAVATCSSSPCRVGQPTTAPGMHRFWAQAVDRSGNRGTSESLEFMVHPSSRPGPSLNTRAQPYHPTSRDRVRFSADASHSSGVSLVEIHVNGVTVKRCDSAHCEFHGGPYAAGTVRWRVSAHSRDGGVTFGTERELAIAGAAASGSCVIVGRAFGPKRDVARVFVLNLYGPDDTSSFREAARFASDGAFRFDSLPAGRYRIAVDTQADVYVETAPRQQTVLCRDGIVEAMSIEFR